VIVNMVFAVLNMLHTGQSNVQFLVLKAQMSNAFIGHLTLKNEVTAWS
jgi:hypothetical protein